MTEPTQTPVPFPKRLISARTIVGAVTSLRDQHGNPLRTYDAAVRALVKAGAIGAAFYLAWSTVNDTIRTLIKNQNDNTIRAIVAFEGVTVEMKLQRTELLAKIPDAKPRPLYDNPRVGPVGTQKERKP